MAQNYPPSKDIRKVGAASPPFKRKLHKVDEKVTPMSQKSCQQLFEKLTPPSQKLCIIVS